MPLLSLHIRPKRPNKNGECCILLKYTLNGQSVCFKTGRTVCPLYFDSKATDNWATAEYGASRTTFNILLKKLKNEAEDKMNRFYIQQNRYPTCGEMKLLLNSKAEQAKTFFTLFDEFMHSKRHEVTTGTYRNYAKFKERLSAYQTYNGQPFTFQSINHSFHSHFTSYLSKQYSNQGNTIGSYIRILKTFLNWAEIHHSVKMDKVVMAGMKVVSEQNFFVWLQMDELQKLAYLDLGDNQILNRSRDAFVLLCCLGCRFGDLQKSVKENIIVENGNYCFRIKTRKNKKLVQVPLSPLAKYVLEKYKGMDMFMWIPKMQDVNYHIKEACKLAGFIDMVEIVRGSGDNRKEIRMPRYKLITTHSGKRTFCNLLRHYGVDLETIRAMTGNSTATIDSYMHPDTEDLMKAVRIFDAPAPISLEPRQAQ